MIDGCQGDSSSKRKPSVKESHMFAIGTHHQVKNAKGICVENLQLMLQEVKMMMIMIILIELYFLK